jgi:hypothetical protein
LGPITVSGSIAKRALLLSGTLVMEEDCANALALDTVAKAATNTSRRAQLPAPDSDLVFP